MENSKSNNSIETLYRLMDNRVEALEFVVCDTPGLTGVQLQDLKLKRTCCFAVLTVAEILLPRVDRTACWREIP